jgi:D-alanyl-D-alanine carboxypeptidase (penicillin-binding protein 5/6)
MATRNGRTLVVTLMGIHESSEWAARKLLDWGFANDGKVAPIGQLVPPLPEGSTPSASGTPEASADPSASTSSSAPSDRSAASDVTARAPAGVSTAMLGGAGLVAVAVAGASLVGARLRRRDGHDRPEDSP